MRLSLRLLTDGAVWRRVVHGERPKDGSTARGATLVAWCASALATLIVVALAIRVVLYRDLPALVTNDSWDYLIAAGDIGSRLDFFGFALRDVRLPGYAVLLALTRPLTHLRSDHIVLLQTACGLVTMALGWAIGTVIGSRLVSLVLAAFLGLDPVYLLHEHAIMCEGFSLTLYVALVLAGLASLKPGAGRGSYVVLGLLLGLTLVTRANALALGATMAGAACVMRALADPAVTWSLQGARRSLRHLVPGVVVAAVALAVIAPWLWRNWSAYGRPVLFASTNRNMVMYKNMHAPLDPATPTLAMVNRALGYDRVDYEWLWKLTFKYTSNEGEELAGRILSENIAKHPWLHVSEIVDTFVGFFGFKRYVVNERTGMVFLFRVIASDVPRMNQVAQWSPDAPPIPDWVYVPRDGNTRATELFARWGSLYLLPGRALASIVFFVMLGLYTLRHVVQRRWADPRIAIVVVLTVGYLATAAMHAMALSDYDRYASMFDFVMVLIAAVMVDETLFP
jgi:hypothetical protein